jgi:geranylgeranyl pyrophosphate synthase
MTKDDFDQKLLVFLQKTLSDQTENFKSALFYSVFSSGKRIRPRFFCAVADMLSLKQQDVFAAAAGIELMHCFTLVHDDLPCMDNADTRRGKPSCHKQFSEAIALLAGDALCVLALQVFFEAKVSAPLLLKGAKFFSEQISKVIEGQASELDLQKSPDIDALLLMHQKKTAALFQASILIPGIFADLNSSQCLILEQIASHVGFAFQMIDDLEDQEPSAINVLYYWSAQEVVQKSRQALQKASLLLKELPGDGTSLQKLLIQIEEKIPIL